MVVVEQYRLNTEPGLTTPNVAINRQFYLNFSQVKKLCLYFYVMLKSVFELSYLTRKMTISNFFQNFKELLFPTEWSYEHDFWLAMRHLSVFSKKCSFATLINIRQKL